MKILVTGAAGFIGRHVVRALRAAGHDVLELHRRPPGSEPQYVAGDFARDTDPAAWRPRLAGVEAVVNAVGILRQSGAQSFSALHIDAPRALFTACVETGVRKVVQISALGADSEARSRYHLSKATADRWLMGLPLAWIVVQPSLVFGEGGASARLFRTLASMPVIVLPGTGEQRVQPVHVDDVAELCVRAIADASLERRIIAAVGSRAYSVRELLADLRHGLGLGVPRFIAVPARLMRLAGRLADVVPSAAFDTETLQMLARGNVAPVDGIAAALGRAPRLALAWGGESLRSRPRPEADWARLNWLLPLLRFSIALVWIVTGIVSLGVYPVTESYALLARVGLSGIPAAIALYGAAALDLLLGLGTLFLRRRLWLWRAQIAVIAGYSAVIALALPEFWLHPFGPLLKNVPLLALLIALHELERRH